MIVTHFISFKLNLVKYLMNQEVINEYCDQLVDNTECDWLEDLLSCFC